MTHILSTEGIIDLISGDSSIVAATGKLVPDEVSISVASCASIRIRIHAIQDLAQRNAWLTPFAHFENSKIITHTMRDIDINTAREYALIAGRIMLNADGSEVSVEDRLALATSRAHSLSFICHQHPWTQDLSNLGYHFMYY